MPRRSLPLSINGNLVTGQICLIITLITGGGDRVFVFCGILFNGRQRDCMNTTVSAIEVSVHIEWYCNNSNCCNYHCFADSKDMVIWLGVNLYIYSAMVKKASVTIALQCNITLLDKV